MSKTLWHTIKIEVPSELIQISKSGKVSIKKSLTKTNNISKSNKQPSLEIIASNVNKPKILNDGKQWNVEELKTRMKKANAKALKNADKNLLKNTEKIKDRIIDDPIVKKNIRNERNKRVRDIKKMLNSNYTKSEVLENKRLEELRDKQRIAQQNNPIFIIPKKKKSLL
jgi:hypothetical protein